MHWKGIFYVQVMQDAEENIDRMAWKELYHVYEDVLENGLIALSTELNLCKMKNASNDATLWYEELKHIHQTSEVEESLKIAWIGLF